MFLKPLLSEAGSLINKILNTDVIFKMEFLQHIQVRFKSRGAINNILNLNRCLRKLLVLLQ